MFTKNMLRAVAYVLTTTVLILPFAYWLEQRGSTLENLSALAVFPLLGLWAFGLMWAHYVMSFFKRRASQPAQEAIRHWYRRTSTAVLVLILLHPILLLVGTGGASPYSYVAPENNLYIFFGFFALNGFLLWEVVERLKRRPFVQKHQPIWGAINNAAFVAIYFHGLFIGQHLQAGWLRGYWYVLGVTAALTLAFNYYYALAEPQDD